MQRFRASLQRMEKPCYNIIDEKLRKSQVDVDQFKMSCIVPNELGIFSFYKSYANVVIKQRVFFLVKETAFGKKTEALCKSSLSKCFLRTGVALLVLCRFSPFFCPGSHKFNRTTTLKKCQSVSHPKNVNQALILLSELNLICPFLMEEETVDDFMHSF